MSELSLKSVYDLLGKNFFIPSYQRGFRWDKRQIDDLLDDLFQFAHTRRGEFYCLQPVVVKKCDAETIKENNLSSDLDNNTWYEVIDGQQRLTSIYLIFRYLIDKDNINLQEGYNTELYRIVYQTHEDNTSYISDPSIESNDSPNAYYISNGYNHILNWFQSLPTAKNIQRIQSVRDMFRNLLTGSKKEHENCGYVQVIWYESDDEDPIKTFTRLNIGKIPLKNAELIKALFLQKRDESEVSQIQQIQIAEEWDQIEATLQNKRLWAFLNKGLPDTPAHIEFIFDVIFDVERRRKIEELGNLIYMQTYGNCTLHTPKQFAERDLLGKNRFEETYGTDEFASFRYFSEIFENANRDVIKNEWNKVKGYYETFSEWYHNPLWYHYIGFLVYCGKPITQICAIYNGKTKKEFANSLIEEIKRTLNIRCISNGEANVEITHNGNPIVYSNKSKETLRQLLVLYNIEFIVQKNSNQTSGYVVFPFDLFKEEKWDIEHVDSFTTNPLTDADQQKIWLQTALTDLKEYGIDFETTEKISQDEVQVLRSFLDDRRTRSRFDEVKLIVSKLAREYLPSEEVHKDVKNSIGNLTLLNSDINRGYGNSIFPSKKKTITMKDATGRFIPICTKNVFLKNFIGVNNTSISWSENDMMQYKKSIISIINKFLITDDTEA